MMLCNHLILCRLLLLLPSIFPSIRVFSNESNLHIRCPKYWSFTISPFNEFSWLIFFRIDWFWSLLQSKGPSRVFFSTTIWKCQFFGAQPSLVSNSHTCTQLQENHSLGSMDLYWQRLMSLLFNMLCRFVVAFLPRGKVFICVAMITICSNFGAQENKICHCFHCFPFYLPWSDGTRCHDLSFLNV